MKVATEIMFWKIAKEEGREVVVMGEAGRGKERGEGVCGDCGNVAIGRFKYYNLRLIPLLLLPTVKISLPFNALQKNKMEAAGHFKQFRHYITASPPLKKATSRIALPPTPITSSR